MSLWVVGKYMASTVSGPVWEFQGVFDHESKAIAACSGPEFFVAPATLNQAITPQTQEWPGMRYPSAVEVTLVRNLLAKPSISE